MLRLLLCVVPYRDPVVLLRFCCRRLDVLVLSRVLVLVLVLASGLILVLVLLWTWFRARVRIWRVCGCCLICKGRIGVVGVFLLDFLMPRQGRELGALGCRGRHGG